VHVRDAEATRMQAPWGSGRVDLEGLVAGLRERGYQGAVAIEYFRDFDHDGASTRRLRDRLIALGVEP
jgi:sugar phosphate isomerase/epimerase